MPQRNGLVRNTYAFVCVRSLPDAPVRPPAHGRNRSDTAGHHYRVVFRRASRARRAVRPGAGALATGAGKPGPGLRSRPADHSAVLEIFEWVGARRLRTVVQAARL